MVIGSLILVLCLFLVGCDKHTESTIKVYLVSGQDTVEINTNWVDAGARLQVSKQEYIMTSNDVVETSTLGVTQVTYEYEYEGEMYQITRYVIVLDQIAPTVHLNAGVDTIRLGNNWIDAGVEVEDNSLAEINIVVTGEVDVFTEGTYEITYTVTDISGNSSNVVRYVDVIE